MYKRIWKEPKEAHYFSYVCYLWVSFLSIEVLIHEMEGKTSFYATLRLVKYGGITVKRLAVK